MATKKFIIEVEEGETPNCKSCLIGEDSNMCDKYGRLFNCMKYNLATMKIKELEDINNDIRPVN